MASFRRAGDRTAAAVARLLDAVRRELAVERRALDRLDPRAQLVADRERVGLLLDRAVRVAEIAIERRATALRAAGADAPRPLLARHRRRPRHARTRARRALAVLGPQATLDRGYAIVRRSARRRDRPAPDGRAGGDRPRDPGRRGRPGRDDRGLRLSDLVVFVAIVAVVLVVGVAVGMLVARPLARLSEDDETPDDD